MAVRNPLTALAARRITNAATVDIARNQRLPVTTSPLFARAGVQTQLETARSSGTVYAITLRISSDVAKQKWELGVDGTDDTIDRHPFLDLWDNPNDVMTKTGRAFRQLAGVYLELLGEATLLVVAVGDQRTGQPVELYPINPASLQPVPDPRTWLAGWIHTSIDGKRTPLFPEQIIQIKYPDPTDPYRGLSPLRAAMSDVDSAVFASNWQRQFFLNSALPGGIVTTDQDLDPGEFREWVQRWNEQHQGVANAGRISLMDKGGQFIAQQMSMVDMQLTELIQANRGGIREAWGISKTMLGQTEDVNRATAFAAERIYARNTLDDRVDLWAEAGNEILSRYGSARRRTRSGSRLSNRRFHLQVVDKLVPDDVEIDVKDRDSRVAAVVNLAKAGGDLASLAEAFELPEFEIPDPEPVPEQLRGPFTPKLEPGDGDDELVDGEPFPELTP